MLADRLRDAGFECTLLEAEPGRPNLIADLAGEATARPCACSDTWTRSRPTPTSGPSTRGAGDVVDGEVRGRGAQDMKGQVAAEVAAAIALAQVGLAPGAGALKLVVTADEEMGAALGRAVALRRASRGGAQRPRRQRGRRRLRSSSTGGASTRSASARRASTASCCAPAASPATPRSRRSATTRCSSSARRSRRLTEQPPLEPTPAGIAFLETVLGEELAGADRAALEGAVERLRALSPPLTAFIAEPMLRVTMVPTKAHASRKENVIPSQAEVLSIAGSRPAAARPRPASGSMRCSGRSPPTTRSSSPSASSATARRPTRRSPTRSARRSPSSTPRRPWSRS